AGGGAAGGRGRAGAARAGAVGLRPRPARAALSALGIAIGIAAMICVVGVASSSRESLNRQLAALGTNLLRVSPGQDLLGGQAHLPAAAAGMIGRIPPVTAVTATPALPNIHLYRSDLIPAHRYGSLAVLAAQTDLPATVGARLASGAWLNPATARYPAVVLGAAAARRLGVPRATPAAQVWLGGHWFTVTGILRPVPLAPQLDYAPPVRWPPPTPQLRVARHPPTHYTPTRHPPVRPRQPAKPQRSHRPPALRRARRHTRRRPHADRAAARPGRGRPAGRRRRRRQHHGHLGARTTPRNRPAPRPRRHPRAHPHPVPRRIAAAVGARRPRRPAARHRRHHRLRHHPALARRRPPVGHHRRRAPPPAPRR